MKSVNEDSLIHIDCLSRLVLHLGRVFRRSTEQLASKLHTETSGTRDEQLQRHFHIGSDYRRREMTWRKLWICTLSSSLIINTQVLTSALDWNLLYDGLNRRYTDPYYVQCGTGINVKRKKGFFVWLWIKDHYGKLHKGIHVWWSLWVCVHHHRQLIQRRSD